VTKGFDEKEYGIEWEESRRKGGGLSELVSTISSPGELGNSLIGLAL
jgi:hypothetical protein